MVFAQQEKGGEAHQARPDDESRAGGSRLFAKRGEEASRCRSFSAKKTHSSRIHERGFEGQREGLAELHVDGSILSEALCGMGNGSQERRDKSQASQEGGQVSRDEPKTRDALMLFPGKALLRIREGAVCDQCS